MDDSEGRHKIAVRKDLADEMLAFLKEEAGGSLKAPDASYIAMIAARFARHSAPETSGIKARHESGQVLVTEFEARRGVAAGAKMPCYVVAPGSSAPLSSAEEAALRRRAAMELRDAHGVTPDRAEAALYSLVVILAMIYLFW